MAKTGQNFLELPPLSSEKKPPNICTTEFQKGCSTFQRQIVLKGSMQNNLSETNKVNAKGGTVFGAALLRPRLRARLIMDAAPKAAREADQGGPGKGEGQGRGHLRRRDTSRPAALQAVIVVQENPIRGQT